MTHEESAPDRAGDETPEGAAPAGGVPTASEGSGEAASERQASGRRRRQRSSPVRWTKSMRETFLDHLAGTCNVRAAAAAINIVPWTVYYERRRNPAFAGQWAAALASGYELLELQLVGHALSGGGEQIVNGDVVGIGPIDQQLALKLMTVHRGAMTGRIRKQPPQRVATRAETDKAILARLDVLAARREAAETKRAAAQGDEQNPAGQPPRAPK